MHSEISLPLEKKSYLQEFVFQEASNLEQEVHLLIYYWQLTFFSSSGSQ